MKVVTAGGGELGDAVLNATTAGSSVKLIPKVGRRPAKGMAPVSAPALASRVILQSALQVLLAAAAGHGVLALPFLFTISLFTFRL